MATSTVAAPQQRSTQSGGKADTGAPTKTMAVLEAVAALGCDASTKDVQGFMEQKYGLQASKDYISDQRMKLKKKKKTPRKAQPAKVKQAAAARPPQVSKPASTNAVAKPAP